MSSEREPLLQDYRNYDDLSGEDPHAQFCLLTGVPPSGLPATAKPSAPNPKALYERVTRERSSQRNTYYATAALSNFLLQIQVVFGATLTALGASESSHVLITIFGVMNTVVAGLVAYLKSRGQAMRARMYRDDLERVVDEIENSEIMWLGISKGVHGYDQINIDDEVTVRSEVARLTRLYDRAVRTNTMNNPDMYTAGAFDGAQTGLGKSPIAPQPAVPIPIPAAAPTAPGAGGAAAAVPTSAPAAAAPVAADPDESPATAVKPKPAAPADSAKDAAKADTEDENKDSTQDVPREGAKEAPKDDTTGASKNDNKDAPKDDAKETPSPSAPNDKPATESDEPSNPTDASATNQRQSKDGSNGPSNRHG